MGEAEAMTTKPIQDLIICKQCGQEHGPTEARHVVRFTCGHCGQQHDGENYEHPVTWSLVMVGNVIRFYICPGCISEARQFFHHYEQEIKRES